ncbi:hypothetical protein BSLG_000829 [Batrachochytrium salamandrivorans]|nr:hypothetical protein BSLG_000829 [Batrachochytrium salamandrivorans]
MDRRVMLLPSIPTVDGKDGSLYVATPYDPLFLLAPILDTHRQKTDESAGRFMQWSDLTSSEDFPDLALLPTTINEAILSNICDINDVDSIGRFYRLNDLKFLDWLKAKVEHLANKAACHSIDAFIPLVQDAKLVHNISDDSSLHRRIAFQAICEHINVKWMNLLMTHLSISDESIWSKQHVYFNPEITKRSASASSATPNLKPTKQAKLTRGQQSIAKASKGGMKHITSFFKPVAAKSASK